MAPSRIGRVREGDTMSGGKGQIAETPQQRAQAEHAMNLMADYKQRWLPVQQRLSEQIQDAYKPGSAERRGAAGRASTDNAIAFDKAQGKVESSLTNAGALPGSGRFDMGTTGLSEDATKSKGLGLAMADQQVEDAYTKGLASLMATGRGERVQVGNQLADQATMSARQAESDASVAAQNRAQEMGLAGQFAGYGMQQAFKGMGQPSTGFGSVPGGYTGPTGVRVNNPSAWPPVGGT
jgi:hypothetical protein